MDLARQIRFAVRRLTQRPGFTAVAVLSLALGIGANTAMFSLLDAVVLRSQPFAEPETLVELYTELDGFPYAPFSYPDFEDVRRAGGEVFAGVTGAGFTFVQLDRDGTVEGLFGELVAANYFSLLGAEPALGRGFLPGEDEGEGGAPVVVLGHQLWQQSFAGDPDILGRSLRLNGRAFTVVGVAPPELRGTVKGLAPQLWAPVSMESTFSSAGSNRLEQRGGHWFFAKARLLPGIESAAVETVLANLTADLKERYPEEWAEKKGFVSVSSRRVLVNPMIDGFLWTGAAVLMALVAVVLTIACANLASFLLARATDQRRDVAIRQAMGATRARLIGQQLLDALVLALLGGTVGAALAAGIVKVLREAPLPATLPVQIEAVIDARVLLFCVAASLLAALLFGLMPALQSTRMDPAPVLKDEGTGGGAAKQRLRSALVLAQVAMSTLLLASAGLFLRSLVSMQSLDPGFGQQPTAMLNLGLPDANYQDAEARRAFFERLHARLLALPEVEAVGMIDNLHLNVGNTQGIHVNVDGIDPPPGLEAHSVDYAYADPGFFATAGVPVVEGRTFGSRDRPDSRPVAIVSQAFAARFFPGRSAVGQILRRPGEEETVRGETEIVGVAGDAMVRLLGEAPRPFVYLAAEQADLSSVAVLARTSGDATAVAGTLLRTARELDPELIVFESKTVADHIRTQTFPSRALAMVFAVFAALALLLAVIGLYGVVSYAAASRSREVGIRLALGASGAKVMGLLMSGGLGLVAAGGALGLLLALAVSKLLGNLLFAVEAADPLVFLGVPAVLLLAAGGATFLPARRALRIDPAKALRTS